VGSTTMIWLSNHVADWAPDQLLGVPSTSKAPFGAALKSLA
jgi:hypothetical protein